MEYRVASGKWFNFYCGYKAEVFNYDTGICKLCVKMEEGSHHIILTCYVMNINMFV